MILATIQKEIQDLYQVSCEESVEDYLLACQKPARFLKQHPWLQHSDEALLVEQNEEALELGLWFKPALYRWGKSQDWQHLEDHSKSLNKISTLIEGVSHFVYLMSRVNEEKHVTQLELELQAEVDKFVLLTRHLKHLPVSYLMENLFGQVTWNPHLDKNLQERYATAFRFAAQYCDYLKSNSYPFSQELLAELRLFYRMNQAEKIRHIS